MSLSSKQFALSEGWISTILNAILFIIKYWVGLLTGSIALIANSWLTLSDSLTSALLIVEIKLSGQNKFNKPAYWIDRAKLIASMIIGILMIVVAINFYKKSISSLLNHESIDFQVLAAVVIAVSIIIKESMAQYANWIYRKTGNLAVKFDVWNHRNDSIISLLILGGMFAGKYVWWIDAALGILVSSLILFTTFKIIRRAIKPFTGNKIKEEINQAEPITK